jgi:hypothetical protein
MTRIQRVMKLLNFDGVEMLDKWEVHNLTNWQLYKVIRECLDYDLQIEVGPDVPGKLYYVHQVFRESEKDIF